MRRATDAPLNASHRAAEPEVASGPSRPTVQAAAADVQPLYGEPPLNAMQLAVLPHVLHGRSVACVCGASSGRLTLAAMIARRCLSRAALDRANGPQMLVVTDTAHRAAPYLAEFGSVEVVTDDAVLNYELPDGAGGAHIVVMIVNHASFQAAAADALLQRMHSIPQLVVLTDDHAPGLLQPDASSALSLQFTFRERGGAAAMPLHLVSVRWPLRTLVVEAGGHANLLLRVRSEQRKFGALRALLQELFLVRYCVIVVLGVRKAERLAQAVAAPEHLAAAYASHREAGSVHAAHAMSIGAMRGSAPRCAVVVDTATLPHMNVDDAGAVVYFDVPSPSIATRNSTILDARTAHFPNVPIVCCVAASGADAANAASGKESWITVHDH